MALIWVTKPAPQWGFLKMGEPNIIWLVVLTILKNINGKDYPI